VQTPNGLQSALATTGNRSVKVALFVTCQTYLVTLLALAADKLMEPVKTSVPVLPSCDPARLVIFTAPGILT
jgi:hypothetical protein